jgi:hypothetical protein
MNPLVIPVLAGTVMFFFLGIWLSSRVSSRRQRFNLTLISLLAVLPGVLFVVYYTGLLGEAGWFYSFRAKPGTELTACGVGLLAGWLQSKRDQSTQFRKQMSAGFIPFVMLLCVAIPYLKQIFLKPDWNSFSDHWSDGVCLQSSESSCGPASAATLLKVAGKQVSEKQIALESFTSRRGTENWYLIRTMRRHGLLVKYAINKPGCVDFSFPSIVGVRLGGKTGAGHFIAVLGKTRNTFVIGDPLEGREELTAADLLDRYYLTGFSIAVITNPP